MDVDDVVESFFLGVKDNVTMQQLCINALSVINDAIMRGEKKKTFLYSVREERKKVRTSFVLFPVTTNNTYLNEREMEHHEGQTKRHFIYIRLKRGSELKRDGSDGEKNASKAFLEQLDRVTFLFFSGIEVEQTSCSYRKEEIFLLCSNTARGNR